MLTDPELRSKVDQIWDRLWSSGLSNPMDSIEQFSYLLFLKRLDDAENQREKQLKRRNKPFEPQIKPELRWSHWINFKADEALKHVREEVFPWLRIGSMNLMLHGIKHPRFFYMDTLSKSFNDEKSLDVVLMNPPFKGKMDESDINPTLPTKCKKTELLFLHLIERVLDMGGRCAVIVPDGVLFGSSKQHQEIRKKIIETHRLDGVVSMQSGVFKPYAGVSTAVLLFTRGGTTDKIWFYDMEHDGFSLDDKRQPVAENDIPDILTCWKNRFNPDFTTQRAQRLSELKSEIAPMKAERLKLLKEINRLTFENAVAPADDEPTRLALEADRQRLAQLHEQMAPLQAEINQLNRQFWVTKAQVKANKYDLSASRYRQIEQDEPYYESPQVTMERLFMLEQVMMTDIKEMENLFK